MKTVDAKILAVLKRHDSATICNVIELLRIRPQTEGFLHHSIAALFPELPPVVGHAVTFTFSSTAADAGPTAYDDMGKHVEALMAVPAPRLAVIQDLDPDPVGASFGEVTATTYIAFGCVGIITSGGARDTEPLRKRRFPLFARSRNVSHGYPHCQAVNVPVEVGGVCIRPGDFLHADANGVTTVPLEQVEQIALLCEEFIAAEREWLGYVDSDHVTPDGVSAALAKFNQFKIRAGKRVRGKMAGANTPAAGQAPT